MEVEKSLTVDMLIPFHLYLVPHTGLDVEIWCVAFSEDIWLENRKTDGYEREIISHRCEGNFGMN